MRRTTLSLLLLLFLLPNRLAAQEGVADPGLLAEIKAVRAVDNHAHVMAAVAGPTGARTRSSTPSPVAGWSSSRRRRSRRG